MGSTLLKYIAQHQPDILLLQEIWSAADYAKIIKIGVEAGFELAGKRNGPNHGLQILIRKGAVKSVEAAGFSTMYKYGIVPFEWLGWVERGLMWAKIVLSDGQRVLIGNTHLTPFTSYYEVRSRQVGMMAKIIENLSFERDHVIVGGDFNIAADFQAYSQKKFTALKQAQWPYALFASTSGLRDAYRSVHPQHAGYSFNPLFDPKKNRVSIRADQRLDYIWAGERTRNSRLHITGAGIEFEGEHDGILPSDHFLVHATLELFQVP